MYSEILEFLKSNLSDKRFSHTLRVAEECMCYADIFNLPEKDRQTLYVAALLHDITKEKSPEEQVELCRVYNIEYNEAFLSTPALFHAITGGRYARTLFPALCTQEVSDLISTHTTGCVNMSLMQKILFAADFTEPTRKHESCVQLREYFHSQAQSTDPHTLLDRTVIMSLDNTIRFLIQTEKPIDPQTVLTRNCLLARL